MPVAEVLSADRPAPGGPPAALGAAVLDGTDPAPNAFDRGARPLAPADG